MRKIFLSWSGASSRAAAQALYDWLPVILQNVKPFMSSEDLRKGGRWSADLAAELESTSFGIICLTKSNTTAPWILFESGALSKFVGDSHVVPLLIGIQPSDLPAPLTQFNATSVEQADFLTLVKNINATSGDEAINEGVLQRSLESNWPKLKESIDAAREIEGDGSAQKKDTKEFDINPILQELLVLARSQSKMLSSPETILPVDYIEFAMSRRLTHERGRTFVDESHEVWADLKNGYLLLVEMSRFFEGNENELIVSRVLEDLRRPIDYLLARSKVSSRSDSESRIQAKRTFESIIRTVKDFSDVSSLDTEELRHSEVARRLAQKRREKES